MWRVDRGIAALHDPVMRWLAAILLAVLSGALWYVFGGAPNLATELPPIGADEVSTPPQQRAPVGAAEQSVAAPSVGEVTTKTGERTAALDLPPLFVRSVGGVPLGGLTLTLKDARLAAVRPVERLTTAEDGRVTSSATGAVDDAGVPLDLLAALVELESGDKDVRLEVRLGGPEPRRWRHVSEGRLVRKADGLVLEVVRLIQVTVRLDFGAASRPLKGGPRFRWDQGEGATPLPSNHSVFLGDTYIAEISDGILPAAPTLAYEPFEPIAFPPLQLEGCLDGTFDLGTVRLTPKHPAATGLILTYGDKPLADTEFSIMRGDFDLVLEGVTDGEGRFELVGIGSGVHTLDPDVRLLGNEFEALEVELSSGADRVARLPFTAFAFGIEPDAQATALEGWPDAFDFTSTVHGTRMGHQLVLDQRGRRFEEPELFLADPNERPRVVVEGRSKAGLAVRGVIEPEDWVSDRATARLSPVAAARVRFVVPGAPDVRWKVELRRLGGDVPADEGPTVVRVGTRVVVPPGSYSARVLETASADLDFITSNDAVSFELSTGESRDVSLAERLGGRLRLKLVGLPKDVLVIRALAVELTGPYAEQPESVVWYRIDKDGNRERQIPSTRARHGFISEALPPGIYHLRVEVPVDPVGLGALSGVEHVETLAVVPGAVTEVVVGAE